MTTFTIVIIESKKELTLYQLWLFCGERERQSGEGGKRKRERVTGERERERQRLTFSILNKIQKHIFNL